MRFMILTAVAALGLTMTAAPAWAAKGVKKNASGEHVLHGTVESVQVGNNGQGTFVLHVHHPKAAQGKNPSAAGQAGNGAALAVKGAGKGAAPVQVANGAASAVKGRKAKGHTITVDQNTKFQTSVAAKGQAAQTAQATVTQLKVGEHVTVHLKGKEAEMIVIHTHTKGKKKAAA